MQDIPGETQNKVGETKDIPSETQNKVGEAQDKACETETWLDGTLDRSRKRSHRPFDRSGSGAMRPACSILRLARSPLRFTGPTLRATACRSVPPALFCVSLLLRCVSQGSARASRTVLASQGARFACHGSALVFHGLRFAVHGLRLRPAGDSERFTCRLAAHYGVVSVSPAESAAADSMALAASARLATKPTGLRVQPSRSKKPTACGCAPRNSRPGKPLVIGNAHSLFKYPPRTSKGLSSGPPQLSSELPFWPQIAC
jgi:hypothetical protein